MTSNFYYAYLLLAFYSREKISISKHAWERTKAVLGEGIMPHQGEFYARLPEWVGFSAYSQSQWQKQYDELKRWQERGISYITQFDTPFFSPLQFLSDPPRALSYMGNIDKNLFNLGLGVVGSREAQPQMMAWLDTQLSQILKDTPLVTVSGGARGVDQQAHLVSIRMQRPTLVLLPSGLLNLYPKNLESWQMPLFETGGAFLSEYHPLTPMKKWHFSMRNRIIVGLSRVVWVPQSRIKSGSWMTAQLAAQEGRNLVVAPASPWDEAFSGNTLLIEQGADLYFSTDSILNYYAPFKLDLEGALQPSVCPQ